MTTRWRLLLVVNLAAAGYSAGAAWLAQLNWQLWPLVGPDEFDAYHVAWWHGVWWAVFPVAAVAFAGVCAQVRWRPPGAGPGIVWSALGLQILVYAGTAAWWAPGQAALRGAVLAGGALDPYFVQLVTTNWLRVALLSAAALLQIVITWRSLPPSTEDRPVWTGARTTGHPAATTGCRRMVRSFAGSARRGSLR